MDRYTMRKSPSTASVDHHFVSSDGVGVSLVLQGMFQVKASSGQS